ncbi:MAG: choice-of-anchor P family protein, partial [Actinomycetota bacterium]
MESGIPEQTGTSRREFIKRSLVAGAAVWSTPSILTLSGARTWANSYPGACCNADAFGLRVIIPALGIDQTFGVGGCVADVSVGAAGTATVEAAVVCGDAPTPAGGPCEASASIATLDVVVGPTLLPTLTVSATVLTSEASAACPPGCDTMGSSSIATLSVNGINVNVSLACNLDALGLGLLTVNEQTCAGDTLEVNALHVD